MKGQFPLPEGEGEGEGEGVPPFSLSYVAHRVIANSDESRNPVTSQDNVISGVEGLYPLDSGESRSDEAVISCADRRSAIDAFRTPMVYLPN